MPWFTFLNGFFASPWFFWAGLACAAGPVIIHLLNRRRYRVVNWAAMDFLREALQRNRRILQMRDLILLALRTLAVLLIGMALARASCSSSSEKFDGSKPLHAVLIVDNSMSMGYQSLQGSLLDRAKERARGYINKLPQDSRVSIVPLCGSQFGYSPDPYTKEDALEALGRIEAVDRSASVLRAVNEAQKACESGPELSKRVVFFSDQQGINWKDLNSGNPALPDGSRINELPSMQVVEVSSGDWENTWISDFRVQDGLADVETPATFIVELMHNGPAARSDVQVTLTVDGVEVASKTVSLEPGLGAREVAFEYVFNSHPVEPGKPALVPVKAAITPDRLTADDERHLVVNVVAALPVVFVDQFGSGEEDPLKNKLGETRHLRKLLAPVTTRGESPRQLVKIRHLKLEDLDRDVLSDARLVVIAGIADPGFAVPLLREYVQQGGQLVIAAGADFDPERWNEAAWLNGAGILPAPLDSAPIGSLPEEARDQLQPFFLSYESLGSHYYFQLADASEQQLRDLYAEPFFFKAVEVDMSRETLDALTQAESERLDEELRFLSESAARREKLAELEAKGELGDAEKSMLSGDDQRLQQVRPNWLLWNKDTVEVGDEATTDAVDLQRRVAELVEQTQPRVLARFVSDSGAPYLVERKLGEGNVLFVSSGLLSDWNTLPMTNTVLIFDRILRSMVQSTLPQRNFPAQERITLPLPSEDQQVTVALWRPGQQDAPEMLDTGFIGKEHRGVSISRPLARGLYRLTAFSPTANREGTAPAAPLWELPLTINGDAGESDLTPLTRETFERRVAAPNMRWVEEGEEIDLSGTQMSGQNMWWYLVLAILGLLFVELAILAWPAVKRQTETPAPV